MNDTKNTLPLCCIDVANVVPGQGATNTKASKLLQADDYGVIAAYEISSIVNEGTSEYDSDN